MLYRQNSMKVLWLTAILTTVQNWYYKRDTIFALVWCNMSYMVTFEGLQISVQYQVSMPISCDISMLAPQIFSHNLSSQVFLLFFFGLGGFAVRLETRRSQVQPPPRSATFFRGDWSWNIFYGHSLPSADWRRAVVSFWQKNVHNTG